MRSINNRFLLARHPFLLSPSPPPRGPIGETEKEESKPLSQRHLALVKRPSVALAPRLLSGAHMQVGSVRSPSFSCFCGTQRPAARSGAAVAVAVAYPETVQTKRPASLSLLPLSREKGQARKREG